MTTDLYFKLAAKSACFDALRWVRENNHDMRSALLACDLPAWIEWGVIHFGTELGIPHKVRLQIHGMMRDFSRQWYFGKPDADLRERTVRQMRELLLPYLPEEDK